VINGREVVTKTRWWMRKGVGGRNMEKDDEGKLYIGK